MWQRMLQIGSGGTPKIIDLVPKMTGYNTWSALEEGQVGGVVEASSVFEDGAYGQYGWKAFAQLPSLSGSDIWNPKNEDANAWIQYRFSSPTCVKRFTITNRIDDDRNLNMKDIELLVSYDGTFTDVDNPLDTYTNSNVKGGTTSFDVNNNKYYLYYRVRTVSKYNESIGAAVAQLHFYGHSL